MQEHVHGEIGPSRSRGWLPIVLVAIAYYVSGRLGLLLALPPGYATAIWPASGIALACVLRDGPRLWPGIWLGSFLINVWTGLDTSGLALLLRSLALPSLIASGATAQALAGAWLVRRYVGYHNLLVQEFDVVRILALGGPLACLIAATVGVGSLWYAGFIPDDVVLFNWWTWWVGDSIGVLVFTPVVLVWSVRPYHAWLRQQLAVTLPLLGLFALVVVVFVITSSREQARLRTEFESLGDQATQRLHSDLERYDVALSGMAGLFSSSQQVTAAEFDNYARITLQQLPGLYAVSWNAVVPGTQRAAFERSMQEQGFPSFQVSERDAVGRIIPVRPRASHVVVSYIRYAGAAGGAQGLDIAFDPVRSAALQEAAASGRVALTERIDLIGGAQETGGLLMFLPVYDRADRGRVLGYATLVLRTQELLGRVLQGLPASGVVLQVLDRSAPEDRQLLFQSGPGVEEAGSLQHRVPLRVAQRDWELQYTLPATYLVAHRSWQAWLVLAAGLLLTALLGILLLVLVGRSARVERLVADRTAELSASEERFRSLLESAPDAMVMCGQDGRIALVNSQAERLFGYSRGELLGEPVETLIPQRLRHRHEGYRESYVATPRARPMGVGRKLFGLRKDGTEFPIEISLSPLRVGEELFVTSAIRDITSRREAEEQLNRTLSVLTATLESTTDGILVVDHRGKIKNFNRQFLEMWQIPDDIAASGDDNMALAAVLPQLKEPDAFLAKVRELYAQPAAESFDLLEFKDGKIFERYSRPQRIGGEIVGRVWSFRDVTQRVTAEAALKASEERYRAAEQTQRAIVAGVIDAIVTVDDQGVVQSFNPAAERMFGWPAEEIIGHSVRLLVPERLHEPLDLAAIDDGRLIGMRHETFGRRRDGGEFPIELAVNRMPHPERRQYVAMVSDISERRTTEAHIQHLAHHDTLTKLPNRALLQDRLTMAIALAQRSGQMLGVMMIDLDHFKRINDSLGHPIGDQLLLTVSDRLRDCVRRTDTVARMGGDEFVVLLTEVGQRADIERVADNIVRQISLPMLLGKHELVVTPSIGVCTYPDDGRDVLALLKNADTAMYHAKEHGRGHYQWFSQDMLRATEEHLALGNALHRALERNEFSLHYQPLVAVGNGRVVGMEALLRWTHPVRGALPPSSFIHLAEESGMIAPIGEWALRNACHDARMLQKRLGLPLTLAVNVSPRQFKQQNVVLMVRRALEDSGLDASCLTLEITESLLLVSREETISTLKRLREVGVGIAVDDFGTGYSSLSYLTRFPINKLKIDGSFVRDLVEDSGDAAIVSAIIAMAKSLHMVVTAEGVETAEQMTYLRQRGCDEVQGYYLSRPVGRDEFAEVVDRIHQRRAPEPLATAPGGAAVF